MTNSPPVNPPAPPLKSLRFTFPLRSAAGKEVTDEHEIHTLLKKEPSGTYPVSSKGLWHGGVHISEGGAGSALDLKHGVRSIADGEVVAFRVNRSYLVSQIPAQGDTPAREARYSTGFVLVRHIMEFPKDVRLAFFSLYMHLQDLAGYENDKTQPWPAYWQPDFTVTQFANDKPTGGPAGATPADQVGLRIRATHPHGTPLCILPRGTQVSISKREGDWGQIKDTQGAQLLPPTAGGYVAPAAAIGGWMFLGKEGGHLVAEAFIPDSMLDRVVTLDKPIKIKTGDLIGHLGRYDSLNQQTENRMVHLEVFSGDDIQTFIQQGRDWVDNHGHHPEDWKAIGLPSEPTILRIGQNTKLYKAPFTEGQDPPLTDVIQIATLANLGKNPDNKHDETEAGSDGKKRTWWHVQSADMLGRDIDGWVRQENFKGGRVTLEHAQSWIDFDTFEDTHDSTHTMFATAKAYVDHSMGADVPTPAALDKLSPLMAKVYRAIYPKGDGSRAADELSAIKDDPWHTLRASRLIIKHESEWANPGKWQRLTNEIEQRIGPKPQHAEEQKRIEKLVWWDAVQAGVPGFPAPAVFHIHPGALVGNFAILENIRALIRKIGDIISNGEGGYESYNTGTDPNTGRVAHSYLHPAVGTVTKKSINSIIESSALPASDTRRLFAVGKYQVITSTLKAGKSALKLTGEEIFNEDMQEQFFCDYLFDKAGGGRLGAFVKRGVGTIDDAQYAASKEWASIAVPAGMPIKDGSMSDGAKSYYQGVANSANKASTDQLRAMLKKISSSTEN